MPRPCRFLPAAVAAVVLAAGATGAARAGGIASLCAEYETRTVVGIIEDLMTEVDDCVRVAAAPGDSPRPVPRPVMLALPVPLFVPTTPIVTAAVGRPELIGGGGRTRGGALIPLPGFSFLPPGRPLPEGQDTQQRADVTEPFEPIDGPTEEPVDGPTEEPFGPIDGPFEEPFEEPFEPVTEIPAVPLPGSGALLALGLLGAGAAGAARRRRARPA